MVTKSTRSICIRQRAVAIRRVAAVELKGVAVRIGEAREMADTGIDRLVLELDSLGLQLRARSGDIGHSQPDRHLVASGLKVRTHRLGRHERQRDVPELALDPPLARVRIPVEAERLAVELVGPLQVLNWKGDEIRPLHLEFSQPILPSAVARGKPCFPREPPSSRRRCRAAGLPPGKARLRPRAGSYPTDPSIWSWISRF